MLQKRNARVFAATLVSIIAAGAILRVLGNHPPEAGAFSLSGYYQLDSTEDTISSRADQFAGRWNRIEVYCEQLCQRKVSEFKTLGPGGDLDNICCHFIVFSRLASPDGAVAATESWQRQLSIAPDRIGGGNERTIRICVAVDDMLGRPTDSQIKRTEAVVEALGRKFDIPAWAIHYPDNWWLGCLNY
jgi:hypothetical protein